MAEYCLRWNNHQPNLVTVFSELLNAESLVDVTLATDGHYIHAHKLVLSACSAYFKDLFGSNPCKHPIVFLKDIRIDDLRTVIDFIYRGEVNVSQERLQDVLKTAESLRIKGLADKPFYEEFPSQSRSSKKHSSSFSSQKSSLSEAREAHESAENDERGERNSSPPAAKKRKLASQDGVDTNKDSSLENEEPLLGESGDDSPLKNSAPSLSVTPLSALEDSSAGPKNADSDVKKEKIKEEDAADSSGEIRAEFQESRAADAMLLLQGSNSDGGDDGAATPVSQSSGGARGADIPGLLGSHTQGSLEWPLSLGHWWASVLPALAQHHHHHAPRPPLYLPRNARSQISPINAHGPSRLHPIDSTGLSGAHNWTAGNANSAVSREGSPAGTASPLVVGSLDQLTLVSALGKEISPQMVQALQAVAARRESFSSAAKLYSVSVTTLWRYYRKLGLSENNNSK